MATMPQPARSRARTHPCPAAPDVTVHSATSRSHTEAQTRAQALNPREARPMGRDREKGDADVSPAGTGHQGVQSNPQCRDTNKGSLIPDTTASQGQVRELRQHRVQRGLSLETSPSAPLRPSFSAQGCPPALTSPLL